MSTFYTSLSKHRAPPAPKTLHAALEPLRFRTSPMFFAACLFACGIFLGHVRWEQPALIAAAFLLAILVTAMAVWRGARVVVGATACAWLCLGILCGEIQPYADCHVPLVAMTNGLSLAIQGVVVRSGTVQLEQTQLLHAAQPQKEQAQQIDLDLRTIEHVTAAADEMVPIDGGLRLKIYAPADQPFSPLNCGDSVTTSLILHEPQRYNDPGVWDAADYLRDQGINVLGSAHRDKITLLSQRHETHGQMACTLRKIQTRASESLMEFADGPSGPSLVQHTCG